MISASNEHALTSKPEQHQDMPKKPHSDSFLQIKDFDQATRKRVKDRVY